MADRVFRCDDCNFGWIADAGEPIIKLSFYNPYRVRCPKCRKMIISHKAFPSDNVER